VDEDDIYEQRNEYSPPRYGENYDQDGENNSEIDLDMPPPPGFGGTTMTQNPLMNMAYEEDG
jgi:hypothetical protein